MTTYAMHAICRRVGSPRRPDNLRTIDAGAGRYGSGWWNLTEQEAADLRGGFLYLHDPSSTDSYFPARIVDTGEWRDDAVELIVEKRLMVPAQPWRGAPPGQNKRHYFRIVEADAPHERE